MILTIVYQSPGGLSPFQIVETLGREYDIQTTAAEVLRVVEKHPKSLVEIGGKIMNPSSVQTKGGRHSN